MEAHPPGQPLSFAPAAQFERRLPVRALHALNYAFCHVYHRLQVAAPPQLPPAGPAIVVSNHISSLDPLLIQAAVPRRLIVWMMAAEYFAVRAMRPVFDTVEVIGVNRNGRDAAATRAALRALEAGRILGIFPEGKIALTPALQPFSPGVALLATKAKVPVHPAYLDGSNRGMEMLPAFALPHQMRIRFGPPLMPTSFSGGGGRTAQLGHTIRSAVATLQQLDRQRIMPVASQKIVVTDN